MLMRCLAVLTGKVLPEGLILRLQYGVTVSPGVCEARVFEAISVLHWFFRRSFSWAL